MLIEYLEHYYVILRLSAIPYPLHQVLCVLVELSHLVQEA